MPLTHAILKSTQRELRAGFPETMGLRVLLHNRFVFNPFWQHHNGIVGFEDWEERFRASRRRFARALQARDTVAVLSLVFDRLHVLRNQFVHGGATWKSQVNRDQVRDGAAILAFLMPVFVDVMMVHPDEDRGRPFYRVVQFEPLFNELGAPPETRAPTGLQSAGYSTTLVGRMTTVAPPCPPGSLSST